MDTWKEVIIRSQQNAGIGIVWVHTVNQEYKLGRYEDHHAGGVALNIERGTYQVQNYHTGKSLNGLIESQVPQALRDLDISDSAWS